MASGARKYEASKQRNSAGNGQPAEEIVIEFEQQEHLEEAQGDEGHGTPAPP